MLSRALGLRVLGAFFLLFHAGESGAQRTPVAERTLPPPMTFKVGRATAAIRIDGALDEDAWKNAVDVPVAWEWSPGDNIPAPVRTQCLVTYDDRNLYVAFRALDPRPGEIRAHLMDRDDTDTLIQDDHVGLMLDTFNDERRAFQFRINPLGVQADAIFSEQDGVEDFSWDMIWASAARITDEGYVVEIALPLKQLRFQSRAAVQTWGFEAFRSWPRNVRHRLSSQPRDRDKGCLLCQENKVTGFEGLAQGRNVELDPTATLSRTDERAAATDAGLARGKAQGDVGVTGRWSVTPNLTLNGTVNPDFSQVEADVAQLDVNQRFALFYPEKRPFFLEGIDFFTTPVQAVFTRTVADPTFGAKLTGKQGANAVGVFVTQDRLNNLLFPANQGSETTTADGEVTSLVGRYRRDVGRGSTVGLLYAGREGSDYHNRQAGVDLFWRVNPSNSIRAQHIQANTRYPSSVSTDFNQPTGDFAGSATYVEFMHQTRSWMAFAAYEGYSPGFRSDTGFVPRVDYHNLLADGLHRWWRGAGSWFNTIDLGARAWRTTDWNWTLTDQTVAGFVSYTGPFQTQAEFNFPSDIVVYKGVRYEVLAAELPGRDQAERRYECPGVWPFRRRRGLRQRQGGYERGPGHARVRVPPDQARQPGFQPLVRGFVGQRRPVVPREPEPAQTRVPHQCPHLRAGHPAVHRHRARTGTLYLPDRRSHAPAVLAVPVLLQAQPPDGALRRLLGQLRRRPGEPAAAPEPDLLHQGRLRLDHVGDRVDGVNGVDGVQPSRLHSRRIRRQSRRRRQGQAAAIGDSRPESPQLIRARGLLPIP